MVIAGPRFKTYLRITMALALLCGCQSPETKRKKQFSTLHVHLEVNRETTERTELVPIWREHPFMVNVQKFPFLNEGNVKQAMVIDVVGGFVLRLQFDRQGTWLLEQYTTANRGRRIAIMSQFGQVRWLAAPKISKPITDGTLVFTPDATREEAERIVRGLNNVAKKMQSQL